MVKTHYTECTVGLVIYIKGVQLVPEVKKNTKNNSIPLSKITQIICVVGDRTGPVGPAVGDEAKLQLNLNEMIFVSLNIGPHKWMWTMLTCQIHCRHSDKEPVLMLI